MYYEDIVASGFAGELWTQSDKAARRHPLHHISGVSAPGLGYGPIHFGGNSGYQSINLAWLWGAVRIVLLGLDCQVVDGKAHWFGQHPTVLKNRQPFDLWQQNFPALARDLACEGVDVINCSPVSALTCFRKADICEIPS